MVDGYLLAAIPVSFLVAALVGAHGAHRDPLPLRPPAGEPARHLGPFAGADPDRAHLFGPQNVQVDNPSWMSGGIALLGDTVLPWNRVVIIGFAAFVLVLIWLMMQKTRLGMFVRAVTQNRSMAGCVGVPTARVDTPGLRHRCRGRGLGGGALSQIANVGPDDGAGLYRRSFMVVVVGGVGQLAGAVWAAMGLGLIAKFLEGWTGAVVARSWCWCSSSSSSRSGRRDCSPSRDVSSSHEPESCPGLLLRAAGPAAMLEYPSALPPSDGARAAPAIFDAVLNIPREPPDNPLPHQHAAQGWLALAIFALVAWVGVPMAPDVAESSPFSVSALPSPWGRFYAMRWWRWRWT